MSITKHQFKEAGVRNLSVAEAAYVAGLVDGEGTIRVQMHNSGNYQPSLSVTMTDKATIRWLQETVGRGSFYILSKKEPYLDAYKFGVYATSDVATLLRQLIPYLITKRAEAIKVLEFCDYKLENK